jgi:hypothetical protein
MTISQEMTMETVTSRQSAENMEFVRRLLREKQPEFSADLELAVMLAERELAAAAMPCGASAAEGS